MRLNATLLLVTLLALGCRKSTDSQPSATQDGESSLTATEGPMPREVKSAASPTASAKTSLSLPGIFKPIATRSTDDLILEVEHPNTKDRLPLLVELATRIKDRDKVLPAATKQMLDGRYAVRVAAAMVAVAVDPEHARERAVDLNGAMLQKVQLPVYGPVQEDTTELRAIQKTAVPRLVKVLESELTADATKSGLYPQTGGVLSILMTIPAEIGKPAIEAVKKVIDTPMHPSRIAAEDVLKKWKVD